MKHIFLIDKKIIFIVLIVVSLSFFSYYLDQINIPGNSSNMIFKVAVDPGHGGIDTGTHYNLIYEKNINLVIGKYLSEELKEANIIPIMTRVDDSLFKKSRSKDLKHRPMVAEKEKVDLFISIHVNNFPSPNPRGSQVFYKKNSKESKKLAEELKESLIEINTVNNRESKPGDYYVLNKVECPAVLIEVGFISNSEDRKNLIDEKYQKNIARAISKGLIDYLQNSLAKQIDRELNSKYTLNNYQPTYLKKNDDLSIYFLNKDYENLKMLKKDFIYPTGSFLNENLQDLNQIEFITISALRQLFDGRSELFFPLSDRLNIKEVKENNGKVTIDLASDIRKNFQGGAPLEEITVKAIYKTIYSIPGVKKIKILIDGKENSTIGGHFILP